MLVTTFQSTSPHHRPKLFHYATTTRSPPQVRCSSSSTPILPSTNETHSSTLTERIFKKLEASNAADAAVGGGAGAATTYADLKRLDAAWKSLKEKTVYGLPPQFVRCTKDSLPATPAIDVVIAGGTLGIFLAAALQSKGLNVALIERGLLKGRSQEWNLSREELDHLVTAGALSPTDADAAIAIEFNPVRAGFHGYEDVWTRDVLNIGVSPEKLIQASRKQFESLGGIVVENFPLSNVWVHPNGIQLRSSSNNSSSAIACKLFIDCMGHQSPIVRQVRHGQRPDGVCCVVGTCARGFDPDKNTTGDIIYTAAPSEPPVPVPPSQSLHNLQLFWEAFPSGSGPTDRTTYMFTYIDANKERPSLEQLLEHYWEAMPSYQGLVSIEAVEVRRILFGAFPTYRNSPLQPQFDRIVAVGDASGIQSPLSFGGLAAMSRHIHRLSNAMYEAVQADAVDKTALKYINAYNPSLSAAWMMQRAMSIDADWARYDVDFINRLLGGNFAAMKAMGDNTLKPFLQDVLKPGALGKTLLAQIVKDPLFVVAIFGRVGVGPLIDWLGHYVAMVGYATMWQLAQRIDAKGKIDGQEEMAPRQKYLLHRALERWEYGSGQDYTL